MHKWPWLVALLLCACASGSSAPTAKSSPPSVAVVPGYHVIDVMPRFWTFWDSAGGSKSPADSAARVALFRRLVIQPESVLYAGSGGTGDANVAAFVARVGNDVPAMRVLSDRISADLPRYGRALLDSFPDFAYDGAVYFYPSLYNRNGGLFDVNSHRVLGFGIDMIARLGGPNANLQALISHEMFHLYHYQVNPEFDGRLGFWGQIWREGLAVYVSQRLTPNASETDVLSDSTLSRAVNAQLPALVADILQHFDDTTRVAVQPYMQSRRVRDDVPPRAGYYIGYRIARKLGEHQSVNTLAHLRGDSLRTRVRSALEELR